MVFINSTYDEAADTRFHRSYGGSLEIVFVGYLQYIYK